MKHLRKFNEDIEDFNDEEMGSETELEMGDMPLSDVDREEEMEDDNFTTSIFNNIESDLSEMSEDEKEDFLKSIISFCDQKLSGDVHSEDDDFNQDFEEQDFEEQEEEEMVESFRRIRKFK
jgi:hypothetical protein